MMYISPFSLNRWAGTVFHFFISHSLYTYYTKIFDKNQFIAARRALHGIERRQNYIEKLVKRIRIAAHPAIHHAINGEMLLISIIFDATISKNAKLDGISVRITAGYL